MIPTRIGQVVNDSIFCGFIFSEGTAKIVMCLPEFVEIHIPNTIENDCIDGSLIAPAIEIKNSINPKWRVPSATELVLAAVMFSNSLVKYGSSIVNARKSAYQLLPNSYFTTTSSRIPVVNLDRKWVTSSVMRYDRSFLPHFNIREVCEVSLEDGSVGFFESLYLANRTIPVKTIPLESIK